jgi:hypothetical protein
MQKDLQTYTPPLYKSLSFRDLIQTKRALHRSMWLNLEPFQTLYFRHLNQVLGGGFSATLFSNGCGPVQEYQHLCFGGPLGIIDINIEQWLWAHPG